MFDVLDLYERRPDIVPAAERHWTNQLALALAVVGDGIPVAPLPVAANLSTTVAVHPLFAHEVTPPFVLHYHNEMDADGFVLPVAQRALNPLIDAFNRQPRPSARRCRLRGPAGARRWRGACCAGSRAAAGTSAGRWPTCAATGCSRRCAGGPSASPRDRPIE